MSRPGEAYCVSDAGGLPLRAVESAGTTPRSLGLITWARADREPGACADAIAMTEAGEELVVPDHEPGVCADAVRVTEVGVDLEIHKEVQR